MNPHILFEGRVAMRVLINRAELRTINIMFLIVAVKVDEVQSEVVIVLLPIPLCLLTEGLAQVDRIQVTGGLVDFLEELHFLHNALLLFGLLKRALLGLP